MSALSIKLAQITVALALLGNSVAPVAAASQLYAVVDGNIDVYNISSNGKLALNATVSASGPVTELALTPDGRFLYATRQAGDLVEYRVGDDGSLQQEGAPFLIANHSRHLHNLLVHPSGDYLFVMDYVDVQVYSLSINPNNGHLTTVTSAGTGIESGALALDPDGDLLFASRMGGVPCGPGGGILTLQIGRGGSLQAISDWTNTGQAPLISSPARGFLNADSQFIYLFTTGFCNGDNPPATVATFRFSETGTLTPAHVYPWLAIGKKIGRFLVLGRDTSLFVYSVDHTGALTQTDAAPIQPTSFAGNMNGTRLFVATADRIVAYRLSGSGRLTRTSDVIVPNASNLTFRSPGDFDFDGDDGHPVH